MAIPFFLCLEGPPFSSSTFPYTPHIVKSVNSFPSISARSMPRVPIHYRCSIRCFLDEKHRTGHKGEWGQKTLGVLYSPGSCYDHGFLKVSDVHTIFYQMFGNPCGKPALFLHGGPGAGCVPRHAGFFDPQHYKIILLDQRGCGKSTPRGCLDENTTWDLVEDLEKLRKHLGVNKWLVMGGSWGVTLALAYGQAHPDAISAFILRGVCMLRQEEIDWFYKQGASSLFPFAWDELLSVLEPSERGAVVPSFYKRLTSHNTEVQIQAARAWLRWEMGLSFFTVSQTIMFWDGKQYSTNHSEEDVKSKQKSPQNGRMAKTVQGLPQPSSLKSQNILSKTTPASEASASSEGKVVTSQVTQALLECHYVVNKGFLTENQLLEGISRIRHIPCVIIHGRYDFVCPVKNAFDLHQAWPEAELSIVYNAGHSMYEQGITRELVSATEQFKSVKY